MSGNELYEENELEEYNEGKGYRTSDIQYKTMEGRGQDCFSKIISITTAVLQVIILLLLVIILAMVAGTFNRFNSIDVCENTGSGAAPNASTAAPVVGSTVTTQVQCNITCNCTSDSNWTRTQVETLVNGTMDTAQMLSSLLTYAYQDATARKNITATLLQILDSTEESGVQISSAVNSLSNIRSSQTSADSWLFNIYLITQEILRLQNSTFSPNNITNITSCSDLKTQLPNSTNGFYTINGQSVYCYMDGQLCGSGGGWTRLAYLDMSDSTQNCPSGLRLYQSGGVRACGRPISFSAGCASIQFPSNGISYTQICGQVIGYQYGGPDAVHPTDGPFGHQNNINSFYADGVLITRGSPRQHVWTLINGYTETSAINSDSNCPCATGVTTNTPSFVGNDFYCESGNNGTYTNSVLYAYDKLWDGQSCGYFERDCCSSNQPWFSRNYGATSTTDNIELRVCGDEGTSNEDTPVGMYEIYVK